jgi:hypothetical protein
MYMPMLGLLGTHHTHFTNSFRDLEMNSLIFRYVKELILVSLQSLGQLRAPIGGTGPFEPQKRQTAAGWTNTIAPFSPKVKSGTKY